MYHKTKYNDLMLIGEMNDDHLINTIRLLVRKIKLYSQEYIEEGNSLTSLIGKIEFLSMKNWLPEWDPLIDSIRSIPYYVIEAQVRGINCTEMIKWIYQRSTMITEEQSEQIKYKPPQININDDDDLPF